MEDSNTDAVLELDALLEEEYQCLVQGNLDALPGLLERKQRFLETSQNRAGKAPGEASEMVLAKFERNQKLLTSAASGLRSVMRRLKELSSISDGSGTYQANGARHQKIARPSGFNRRA